jgi:hypothetical protein
MRQGTVTYRVPVKSPGMAPGMARLPVTERVTAPAPV